jgi:RNA recognition motif-containing protein
MGAKIFVGNLHPRTTKLELERFFAAAGRVASISIPVDRETGRPRGFCFVEFAERESVDEAFSLCEGRELNGNRLRLSLAREQRSRRAGRDADRRPSSDYSFDQDGFNGRAFDRDWDGSNGDDGYAERRRARRRGQGKHGRDRKRLTGTRRVIE